MADRLRRPSVFGDQAGLAVFLGALSAVGATWQVGFFITDTYAVANALANLAHGDLAIERVYYSLTLGGQPGLVAVDGHLYARNYGQAFLALPLYYGLAALATVADLGLLLVALWALVVGAFCRQVGVVLGRRARFQTVGSVLAAVLVVTSVPLVDPVEDELVGLVALQVLSMLAVGVTAVAVYRSARHVRGRRMGVAAGAATVLTTPLWFWAAVPKRHTLTAAVVAVLLFWFATSREPGGQIRLPVAGRRVYRSLALRVAGYLLVGLVAWVHAFEGIVLLGVFGLADLTTASTTSRRVLVAIAVAVTVGFAPFVATNVAVTGDPLQPPRLAPSYFSAQDEFTVGPEGGVTGPADQSTTDGEAVGTSGDENGGSAGEDSGESAGDTAEQAGDGDEPPGTASDPSRAPSFDPFAGAVGFGERVTSYGGRFAETAGSAPARLYRTYVRSGRADALTDYHVNDEEAIELSLLESNPLFGGVLGGLLAGLGAVVAGRRGVGGRLGDVARSPGKWRARVLATDPARRTDVFALAVVAGFGALYFPFLPLFSQLTVRYLLPAVPALVYLLGRVPAVATAVETRPRLLAGWYGGAVAAGLLGLTVAGAWLEPAVGEAMQLHALVNLAACGILAIAVLVTAAGADRDTRVRTAAVATAGAATTVLVVAMQLAYFEYGTYAVPVVRLVADAVTVLG